MRHLTPPYDPGIAVHRALLDLELLRTEQGIAASSVDWERLLTFSYQAYVPRGGTVVDVGAHHGMHTRRLRRYLRPTRLVAVEPIPDMAAGLRREFRRHREVEVLEVALGRASGSSRFVVNDLAPGESGLRERRYNAGVGQTRAIDVRVERLDELGLQETGFIKVDVEGGEIDVLRGGTGVLRDQRPIVSVEYGSAAFASYGNEPGTLLEVCQALGYRVLDLFGNVIDDVDWPEIVDAYYWDYVLVPSERVASLAGGRAQVRERAMRAALHPHPRVERWRKRLRR